MKTEYMFPIFFGRRRTLYYVMIQENFDWNDTELQ